MNLSGKKVAVLAANGFEQSELEVPVGALKQSGVSVTIVSPEETEVRGWDGANWGRSIPVDLSVHQAKGKDFDALVLPGGVMNPDKLRANKEAVEFVRHFVETNKPIAAICHGPWTLIEAGGVAGRRMTSYRSIKTDLINAGAEWVDNEVIVDNGLVTSRSPDDLQAFCKKMLEEISEGAHNSGMSSDIRVGA